MKKENKGITLVALVITIIIMLILAAVTISMLFGENGLIKRAQNATTKWNEASQNELDYLNYIEGEMDNATNKTGGNTDNNTGGENTGGEEPITKSIKELQPRRLCKLYSRNR